MLGYLLATRYRQAARKDTDSKSDGPNNTRHSLNNCIGFVLVLWFSKPPKQLKTYPRRGFAEAIPFFDRKAGRAPLLRDIEAGSYSTNTSLRSSPILAG